MSFLISGWWGVWMFWLYRWCSVLFGTCGGSRAGGVEVGNGVFLQRCWVLLRWSCWECCGWWRVRSCYTFLIRVLTYSLLNNQSRLLRLPSSSPLTMNNRKARKHIFLRFLPFHLLVCFSSYWLFPSWALVYSCGWVLFFCYFFFLYVFFWFCLSSCRSCVSCVSSFCWVWSCVW